MAGRSEQAVHRQAGDLMRVTHHELYCELLRMAVPQVGFVLGVAVQRVDGRRWSVAGGASEMLLVAMDELMRAAGLRWC
jgi:hypothetical protein